MAWNVSGQILELSNCNMVCGCWFGLYRSRFCSESNPRALYHAVMPRIRGSPGSPGVQAFRRRGAWRAQSRASRSSGGQKSTQTTKRPPTRPNHDHYGGWRSARVGAQRRNQRMAGTLRYAPGAELSALPNRSTSESSA
jgi:hypothetical protein